MTHQSQLEAVEREQYWRGLIEENDKLEYHAWSMLRSYRGDAAPALGTLATTLEGQCALRLTLNAMELGAKNAHPAASDERLTAALTSLCGDALTDPIEARARFIEEAHELAQAAGATIEEIQWSAKGVFAKPSDPVALEIGQVSTALHRLALAHGVVVADEAAKDLAHIERNVDAIRERHERKPRFTPSARREGIEEAARPIDTAEPWKTDHMRPVLVYWTSRGWCETYYDIDDEWDERPKGWVSPQEGWRSQGDQCIPVNQKAATHWQPMPPVPAAIRALTGREEV